jgi:hypothetical protein
VEWLNRVTAAPLEKSLRAGLVWTAAKSKYCQKNSKRLVLPKAWPGGSFFGLDCVFR